ncbi:hypothetical protein IWX90DRAFT_121093 [Phyllosticta citrichinensis]|uniref:Uncharacterized protein n=1 Tax=Phyllosticta citrichinensis TaxID=1130410 RepID=A0ABR1Y3M4_9PEZI
MACSSKSQASSHIYFQTLQLTTCTDQDLTKTEPIRQPTPRRAEPEQETIIIVVRRRRSFISFNPTFEAPLGPRQPGLKSSRIGPSFQHPFLFWSGLAGWTIRRVSWFYEVRSGPGLLGTLFQHVLKSPLSKLHGQFAIAFRSPKVDHRSRTISVQQIRTIVPQFYTQSAVKKGIRIRGACQVLFSASRKPPPSAPSTRADRHSETQPNPTGPDLTWAKNA